MKAFYPLLLLFFCFNFIYAGNDKNAPGAKSAAMGHASLLNGDAFATFANQAALTQLKAWQLGIYAENRFLISDLNLYAIAAALPIKSGTFGIGINYFGNEFYNEKQVKLAYGRELFKGLSLGIELDWINLSIDNYGSTSAFTFGAGILYQLSDKAQIGCHVFNPLRIQLTDLEEDKLPTVVKIGASFSPIEKLTVTAETEKNIQQKAIFKAGVEYQIIEKLYLRGGISSNPGISSFGIGLNLGILQLDFANSFHPTLGYSPHLSLSFAGRPKMAKTTTESQPSSQ